MKSKKKSSGIIQHNNFAWFSRSQQNCFPPPSFTKKNLSPFRQMLNFSGHNFMVTPQGVAGMIHGPGVSQMVCFRNI
jgi:hypothetical protein